MAYNRYHADTGRWERVEEALPPPPKPVPPPPQPRPAGMETEDLLILAVLWLLYRGGAQEMLLAMAAYLFLP